MLASEFVEILKNIAKNHKTVYAWGMFGSPINEKTVKEKSQQYPTQYTSEKFVRLYGKNYWGFDCIGLVKGALWGWSADSTKSNGGAIYASRNVPDISADSMITKCSDVDSNFFDICIGEFVWMKGHCGVYIGNGKVVESTPKWENGVQITALSSRKWLKHGKLPYVEYEEVKETVTITMAILEKGTRGEQVKALQRLLIALGYNLGKYGADGDFGKKTDTAVRSYQKTKNLTVDGIVGKNTWSKILGVN